MTRVVPLWVSARGEEFSWSSLQAGLESNLQLVICLFYFIYT